MAHTPKNQSEKAILTARRAWCYLALCGLRFIDCAFLSQFIFIINIIPLI